MTDLDEQKQTEAAASEAIKRRANELTGLDNGRIYTQKGCWQDYKLQKNLLKEDNKPI